MINGNQNSQCEELWLSGRTRLCMPQVQFSASPGGDGKTEALEEQLPARVDNTEQRSDLEESSCSQVPRSAFRYRLYSTGSHE